MTLLEMVNQGEVFQLICLGLLLFLMGFLINKIGKDVIKLSEAREKNIQPSGSVVQRATSDGAVTAAICAAVNQYRIKNK